MIKVHYGVQREVNEAVIKFATSLTGEVVERIKALRSQYPELDLAAARGVIEYIDRNK